MAPGAALGTSLALLLLLADSWSKTFAPVGTPELRVEAAEGSVSITAADRPDIAVQVTTKGWKISETEVWVKPSLTGNRLELHVAVPTGNAGFTRRGLRMDIQVPRETGCEIKTGAGSIDVTGVHGRVNVSNTSGPIRASELDGKIEAHAGQGRIAAAGRFDALTLSADFGAIEVSASPGSKMFSPWRLATNGGNIVLHLPSEFRADLDAEASLGKVTVDLPIAYSGPPDSAHIRGALNGGGETLRIRAEGANIRVLKPGSK